MHILQHLSICLLLLACSRAEDSPTHNQEDATSHSAGGATTKGTTKVPTTNLFDRFRTKAHFGVSSTRSAAELFTQMLRTSVSTTTERATTTINTTSKSTTTTTGAAAATTTEEISSEEVTETTTVAKTARTTAVEAKAAAETKTPATTPSNTTVLTSTQMPVTNVTSTSQKSNITSTTHQSNITSTKSHKLHCAHHSKTTSKHSKTDLKTLSSGCQNHKQHMSLVLLLLLFSYESFRAYN